MTTQSARQAADRPFYAAYGRAYDLLVTHPVKPWTDLVSAAMHTAGITAPARILDAGCGTGRHAAEFARRGYRIDLADASDSLLAQARERLPHAAAHQADLCMLDLGTRYDAITCRGVLNDVLHDQDRDAAIAAFARHLRATGLLFLDVRDMDGTRQRYARGLITQRTVSLDGGDLTFRTAGTFEDGLLHVRERYEHHRRDGSVGTASYKMTMRPWDPGELHARLGRAGLTVANLRHGADRPANDHLICIAAPATAPDSRSRQALDHRTVSNFADPGTRSRTARPDSWQPARPQPPAPRTTAHIDLFRAPELMVATAVKAAPNGSASVIVCASCN